MIQTHPCNHCGSAIRFEEEDRGGEVYCPSCGRANLIPEARSTAPEPVTVPPQSPPPVKPSSAPPIPPLVARPAPPPVMAPSGSRGSGGAAPATRAPRRSAKVFGWDGAIEVSATVVGKVTCLCLAENPVVIDVTVADYETGAVYCPNCHASIPVGDSLLKAAAAQAQTPEQEQAAAALSLKPKPRSRRAILFRTAALLLVSGSVLYGGYLAWRYPESVPFGDYLPWNNPLVGSGTQPPHSSPDQRSNEHPTEPPPPKPERAITLADIAQLLQRPEARQALIEAQLWRQMLMDRDVPESDARRAQLEQVIQTLTERLTPQPTPPPPFIAEFRGYVQQLRDALAAENLTTARQANQKAEALFNVHPQELAPFSRSYLSLKAKLQHLELLREGVQKVETLLVQARNLARKESVAEAIEQEARARFLALRTPMSKDDETRLNTLIDALRPELLLARGKRAVQEAERCLSEGNAKTLSQLVREARTVLPGLPESQIIAEIKKLEEIEKKKIDRTGSSLFDREIVYRFLYEKALENLGAGEIAQTATACQQAHQELTELPQHQQQRSKLLGDLVFEVLEPMTMEVIALPDRDQQLTARLLSARKTLDSASPWSNDPRWRKLDVALRQRGVAIALNALEQAIALGRKDELQQAVTTAQTSLMLGEAEVVNQAKELIGQWQKELDLRASLKEQDRHWKQIEQLRKENKILEAWGEVRRFQRRFPDSPRLKEAKALNGQLAAEAESKIGGIVREADSLRAKQDWKAFRQLYELLRSIALPAKFEPQMQQFREELDRLARQAEGRFAQVKAKYARMFNQEQVMTLLEELPRVLEMNPNLEEARMLYQTAVKDGQARATKLMATAQYLKEIGHFSRYRTRLQEISRLDPEGATGNEARKLLEEIR